MREKFEMRICTEAGCETLGFATSEERAAKRIDREVKRRAKKIRGKPRRGVVKGSVVDRNGLVRYRAHEEFGAPESPAPRRRRRPIEPLPPLPMEE